MAARRRARLCHLANVHCRFVFGYGFPYDFHAHRAVPLFHARQQFIIACARGCKFGYFIYNRCRRRCVGPSKAQHLFEGDVTRREMPGSAAGGQDFAWLSCLARCERIPAGAEHVEDNADALEWPSRRCVERWRRRSR